MFFKKVIFLVVLQKCIFKIDDEIQASTLKNDENCENSEKQNAESDLVTYKFE